MTIGWNAVEGIIGIVSGVAAGSIALIGFGVDSYVEVLAGATILWRLAKERHGQQVSQDAERRAVRIIATTFLALAVGVGVESLRKLLTGQEPEESLVGIGLAVVSLIVMPLLARAKRQVGQQLHSGALVADATETALCVWLSAILLVGLGLNALFGWWWADPLAGLRGGLHRRPRRRGELAGRHPRRLLTDRAPQVEDTAAATPQNDAPIRPGTATPRTP